MCRVTFKIFVMLSLLVHIYVIQYVLLAKPLSTNLEYLTWTQNTLTRSRKIWSIPHLQQCAYLISRKLAVGGFN